MVCCRLALAAIALAVIVTASAPVAAQARRELSFRDAVTVALAHNGELALAHSDAAIAADDVALAGSVFAPRLVSSARASRERQPGNAQSFAWTDQLASASLGIAGRAPTGLSYALDLGATAERLSSPFLTVFDPAYTTGLTLSLTQPLLRGGWRAANRQPIVVASLRRDVTVQQLRVRLEQLVGEVEVAYWSLALAHKEREAREASLKLATDQLGDSTRLAKLGTISELDVLEARAGVGRNRQQLLRAEQQVTEAEGKLRAVIVGNPDWQPDDALIPSDDPALAPVSYSIDEHVQLARRNRPDLVAAHTELQAEHAALAVTQDGLRPALDVIATASKLGFAGELERNYVASGISAFDGTLEPGYAVDPALNGGLGHAFKNLATSGNYTVSLGLKLELPLDNSAAQARHDRQRHVMARAQTAEQALLRQVDNEVRTSVALLRSDEALQQAADDAVAVNERLLVGMRKRFAAGTITSFDVLRVADELTRAKIDAARARVSYRISLARLATADGTLLPQLDITPSSLPTPK